MNVLITVAHGPPLSFWLVFFLVCILLYFVLPAISMRYLLKSKNRIIKLIASVPVFIILFGIYYAIIFFVSNNSQLRMPPFVEKLFFYSALSNGAICILFLLYKFIKKRKSN